MRLRPQLCYRSIWRKPLTPEGDNRDTLTFAFLHTPVCREAGFREMEGINDFTNSCIRSKHFKKKSR
jgi:hypothetical protein